MAEVKTDPKLVSEIVLVCCKLPHGLNLDLYSDAIDGARVPALRARVKLPGIMKFHIPNDDRKFVNPEVYKGHTITEVPRKHWEEWAERNKNHPALVNGFIFVSKTEADAKAQASERQKELTGFEQLDPKKQGVQKFDADPRPAEMR